MQEKEHCWDVIVLGAGAGGMTSAAVAAAQGRSVLLIEQSPWVGGTTAISGGMTWIPANSKMHAVGREDTLEQARDYLRRTVRPTDEARLEAFLRHGDEAIRALEAFTDVRLRPVATYPDYYPDLPGATLGGRVLEPAPYDASALGSAFSLLRPPLPEFMLWGAMMVSRQDIPHLRRAGRSWSSARHVIGLLARHARERLRAPRGLTLHLGNALAARLLASCLRWHVEVRTSLAPTASRRRAEGGFEVDVIDACGRSTTFTARRALVLATGGVSHSRWRERFTPAHAGSLSATIDSGPGLCGADLGLSLGAALSPATDHGAFWVPASRFVRSDGSAGVYPHTVTDRGKPGLVAVDGRGRRFLNEALSYHEFVRAQLAQGGGPVHLVCDRRFLWRYGLGRIKPFALSVREDLSTGYLHRASTLEGLARSLRVPVEAFGATLARYNEFARRGDDPDFGKGGDAYQRHLGDAEHQPNPCLAPIEHAPFYAVTVVPADLGMSGGLQTNAQAQVLDAHGAPIEGLFACGNDIASIMEGAYPGPGITLGPALVFGWLAGRQAAFA